MDLASLNEVRLEYWDVTESNYEFLRHLNSSEDVRLNRIWQLLHHAAVARFLKDEQQRPVHWIFHDLEGASQYNAEGELPTADIEGLVALMTCVGHPGLRARLGDVAFHAAAPRDRKLTIPAVKEAVLSYLEFAVGDINHRSNRETVRADALLRAVDLFLEVLSKDKALKVLVVDAVHSWVGNPHLHPTARLMVLQGLLETTKLQAELQPQQMAKWAVSAAATAERGQMHISNLLEVDAETKSKGERLLYIAWKLYRVAVQWSKKAKDEQAVMENQKRVEQMSQLYARQERQKGNHLWAADHLFQAAIELRNELGSEHPRVIALHREAREALREGRKSLQAHEMDLTPRMEEVRPQLAKSLEGKSLQGALFQLAHLQGYLTEAQLEQHTQAALGTSVVAQLFGSKELSSDDRVTAQATAGSEEQKAHWRAQLQDHARQVFVWVQVHQMRELIQETYQPTPRDIAKALEVFGLIGPEDQASVVLGIDHALRGQNLIASHLLVPHLETVLRRALDLDGDVLPTSLKADRTEDVRLLNPMLDNEVYRKRLDAYFGKDFMFEVASFFTTKPGPNVRNGLCHGFLPDQLYQDWYGCHATHLVMRAYLTLPQK